MWDMLSPAQWVIVFGVLLIAVIFMAVDLINNEPWGGFRL
jgi:hypothetical protein